jgi:AAA domain
MQLPTSRTPAERRDPRFILIYGPPKIGKTTILSQLEDNLIIDTESGTDFLEALKLKTSNEHEFRETCSKIASKQPRPYRHVSIDTIDVLEDWAEELATIQYKSSNMGKNFTDDTVLKLPNGAGYLWLRDAFKELLQLTMPLARSVIYTGHVRDKFIGETSSTQVSTKELDLTGKVRKIICSSVDVIGYLSRDKNGNFGINFQSSEAITCGSRCDHLKGQAFWFEGSKFDWKKIFIDT